MLENVHAFMLGLAWLGLTSLIVLDYPISRAEPWQLYNLKRENA